MPGHRGLEPGASTSRRPPRRARGPPPRASITSGITPAPITTQSQSSSSPPFVTTLRHAAVGALEALELVAAVHLHAVLLEHALEEARRPRAPNWRSSVTSSSITIEHLHAVRGGERRRHLAADVAAADQHHALGVLGVGADRVRVAERAQVVDARRGRSRRRAAGARSRRWRAAPLSNSTSSLVDSVATRSAVSSFITLVRVSSSMSCSSHHSSGRNSTSSRDSLPCR